MDTKKEIGYLKDAIVSYGLDKSWRDGLFIKTDEEREARYVEKYTEAESAFLRMMRTPKNDGSERWRNWAIKKALGFTTGNDGVGFKKSSTRSRNRSLG